MTTLLGFEVRDHTLLSLLISSGNRSFNSTQEDLGSSPSPPTQCEIQNETHSLPGGFRPVQSRVELSHPSLAPTFTSVALWLVRE